MAATLLAVSEPVLDWLTRTTWQAAVLVAIVVAVQLVLGRLLSPRWRYALWLLVVVRLLMPVTPVSPWSVFNLSVPQARERADHERPIATPQAADGATVSIVRTFDARVRPAAAVSAPAAIRAGPFDWKQALLAVWLAGAALLALRFAVAHALLTRRLRRAPEAGPAVAAVLADCQREMGKRGNVQILATDAVGGPALFGFFRPQLLVPPAMLCDLSADELRFVFLHELAHLKRWDTLTNVALTLAGAVHWFNPLVWFALSRCRAERELACDAMVLDVADSPAGPQGYGQTMLRLAEALRGPRGSRGRVPAALGILETRSQLTRRITMISAFRRSSPAARRWSALPALLLVGVASCTLTDKPATSAPARAEAGPVTRPAAADDGPGAAELNGAAEQLVVDDRGDLTVRRANGEEGEREATPADAAAQAQLEKRLPELKLDNVPFHDVIDALRDLTSSNIFVNWRALEAAGIDRKTPVTTQLRNVRFARALQVIFDDVGGDTVKLGYTLDDGVITVSTADDLSRNTLTRVYDVRDLIMDFPNAAPAPPKGAAEPVPAPATQPQQALTEELVELIRETIEPEAWREAGGSVASLRQLAGQLIITATPEMHAGIANLLAQVREGRGVQVTVEARFVTIDPAALDEVLGERFRNTLGRSGVASAWQLSDAEVKAVLRATQQDKGATILTAPRITLFSGQRGYVNVSTQTAYVSGFTIFKKEGGETRYEPKTDVAESGVILDVTAVASADRKQATLTLKPKLSRLVALRVAPYMESKDLSVQVPEMLVHELQATLGIPDRGTALIGGFTESPAQATATLTANHVTADAKDGQIILNDGTRVDIPKGGKLTVQGSPIRVTQGNRPATQSAPPSNLYLLVKPTLIVTVPEPPKGVPMGPARPR